MFPGLVHLPKLFLLFFSEFGLFPAHLSLRKRSVKA